MSSSSDSQAHADDPAGKFRRLIAVNDARILGPDLDNGLEIAAARTAIHEGLMAEWAAAQQSAFGYERPFAVVALGGTGRGEMTPCSDTDFAFLFDDVIEGNPFLLELQQQLIHTGGFRRHCGFGSEVLPFNLDDMPELDGKQLNSFLDMKPVYDPADLATQFRKRIRATFDPFEHFLHVSTFWRDHQDHLRAPFEHLDRFDIKNDGLRVFLAGVWTLAGRKFVHCHEIYESLDDPRDLEAYGFLLRIRAYVHLRRGTQTRPSVTGNHAEDVLGFDDFLSFGNLLGPEAGEQARFEFDNEVRARLLSARRRVDRFARGVVGHALRNGREIRSGSSIVLGLGGLRDAATPSRVTARDKSRAAMAVLLVSQRYGVPINPAELESTFKNVEDWLVPVPELSDLFYEPRGSLADSFKFLSQFDGAEDRLFPGYAKFETSLDARVMTEQRTLRGAIEREKIRAVEAFHREGLERLAQAGRSSNLSDPVHDVSVPVETALLDVNHLAAIKLALKTKRLPETAEDLAIRDDETLPLHDRFSSGMSGIPLDECYSRSFRDCGFVDETPGLARFLVSNRWAFKEQVGDGLLGEPVVNDFAALCGDELRLRALFVFTCADRVKWGNEEKNPTRWFNIRELFSKARMVFRPSGNRTGPLADAGYSPDELAILEDFGKDFFDGAYRQYAVRFGSRLVGMVGPDADPRPHASVIRRGPSLILGVAARDDPGIAASISGALWEAGIPLNQAHLFSSAHHGLALDFFHLAPGGPYPDSKVTRAIEDAIATRRFAGCDDEGSLPDVAENVSLHKWQTGLYCLCRLVYPILCFCRTWGVLIRFSILVYSL